MGPSYWASLAVRQLRRAQDSHVGRGRGGGIFNCKIPKLDKIFLFNLQ